MHNHYYFLRQLSARLDQLLTGFTLVSCFSQEKDELVIEFNNEKRSFFLKCSLQPDLQCLSFPGTFRRARKNSIDLFTAIVMKPVRGVMQFNNERSFGLQFDDGWLLVFKMHGLQANVILFLNESVKSVFRHNLPADTKLQTGSLDREIDWSGHDFLANPGQAKSIFFTFGKPVWDYLDSRGFAQAPPTGQWSLIQEVKTILENPEYSLVDTPGRLKLTLLPEKNILEKFHDPVAAVNAFFLQSTVRSGFDKQKAVLLGIVRARRGQGSTYLAKTRQRLKELESDVHYSQWADLLMANLHRISAGTNEVDVEDFHDPGRRVIIKLRKELSPQKNAEVFYRKAKNQAIEKRKLGEAIASKEKELEEWASREQQIMQARSREDLQQAAALFQPQEKLKEKNASLPYREYAFGGYTIRVGKNAAANDELTLHHTFKEDLWLHAKDVAGSHVIIKHQAGKKFPKDVVAYAASLAAFYSRRKNESLCPVAVTPAKYVRKRKGDPPGMVLLQREEVVMAVPNKEAEK